MAGSRRKTAWPLISILIDTDHMLTVEMFIAFHRKYSPRGEILDYYWE